MDKCATHFSIRLLKSMCFNGNCVLLFVFVWLGFYLPKLFKQDSIEMIEISTHVCNVNFKGKSREMMSSIKF